jgi:LytS/YehU family sensor histidine kinase
MKKISQWIRLTCKQHVLTIIGALIGAIAGFLYWYFIGCTSGSCPIQSNPVMSTIWGLLLGGLIFSLFEKRKPS